MRKKSSDGATRGRGRKKGCKCARASQTVLLVFLHLAKRCEWEEGGGEGAAVSFPNELNVMNEVESWKTHSSAASNSMRDEASRGKGDREIWKRERERQR